MGEFYRWWSCHSCGRRMLTVRGFSAHWLMSDGRRCLERRKVDGFGRLDPWQARRWSA